MIKKLKHQNITFIFNNKTNIKNRKIYKIQVSKFIYQLNGCLKETKEVRKSYHSIFLSAIRQKGESLNGGYKKRKHVKFSEKRTFLRTCRSVVEALFQRFLFAIHSRLELPTSILLIKKRPTSRSSHSNPHKRL